MLFKFILFKVLIKSTRFAIASNHPTMKIVHGNDDDEENEYKFKYLSFGKKWDEIDKKKKQASY